jgi:hypothetical protein
MTHLLARAKHASLEPQEFEINFNFEEAIDIIWRRGLLEGQAYKVGK